MKKVMAAECSIILHHFNRSPFSEKIRLVITLAAFEGLACDGLIPRSTLGAENAKYNIEVDAAAPRQI